jgi:membrane fusion protein (multidrug efflux system)
MEFTYVVIKLKIICMKNLFVPMKHRCVLYSGILLMGLFSQCQSNAGGLAGAEDLAADTLPQEKMLTEVKVALAEEKAFIQEVETSGTIQAREAADAVWETGGIIADVRVRNGQRVEKGQVLAVLENRKEQLQLKKARIALKEKQISYASESLGADSLRQQYLEYHTGLAMTEVALEEAELAFEQTTLRAPISGIISDLALSVGARVQAGESFCHLWDPKQMELLGYVMETQLATLKVGQQAVVRPLGSEKEYVARLQGINTRINEHGLVEVRLGLQEAKDLVPGRNAKAFIQIPHQQTIVVPKEAVVLRSGKPVVFVYKKGLAEWKYVATGMENGKEVAVLEGLVPQDSVIITNNLQLAHDARVKIVGE